MWIVLTEQIYVSVYDFLQLNFEPDNPQIVSAVC